MESRRGRPVRRLKNRPLIFYAPGLRPTFPSKPPRASPRFFMRSRGPRRCPLCAACLITLPSPWRGRRRRHSNPPGKKRTSRRNSGPCATASKWMENPTPLAAWNGSSAGALPACGLVPRRQRMRRVWPTCRATCSSTNPQGQSNRSPCAARPGSDSRTRCSACSYLLLPIPMMGVFD